MARTYRSYDERKYQEVKATKYSRQEARYIKEVEKMERKAGK